MQLSERQQKILQLLIEEYIDSAKPVSSDALKKRLQLNISPATIRNELQNLDHHGYVHQPHTSAGRVPTEKAYHFFAVWIEHSHQETVEDFIMRQIEHAKAQVEKEMEQMEKCMQTLEQDNIFEILKMLDTWHKKTLR